MGGPILNRVRIIGAGPAGLTAAIVLRRHGIPVTVFEKSSEVGHRLSGDFQGLENWSSDVDITDLMSDVGIKLNFLCEPYSEGIVYTAGMEPRVIKSEKPIFYLVRRGPMAETFDTGLKEQALELGAEIRFENGMSHLQGKAIVGTGPKGADIIATGIIFDTAMEDRAAVVLDNNIAPGGYAYLLVNNGKGTLAIVMYRDFRKQEAYFRNTLAFFNSTLEMDIRDKKRFAGFGNFFLRDSQVRHGKIYVGESAGFQDCLWGFGMRYSILSGYLAARSILEGENYDVLWKRELGPMLEASLINRYLIEKFGHSAYRYLTRRLSSGDPCRYLKRHYNRMPLKHMLLPLARRGFSSRVHDHGSSL